MVDQMWNKQVGQTYQAWEDSFYAYAFENGMINPMVWIADRGIGNYTSDEYKAILANNKSLEATLRSTYETINPCPIKRFARKG
jgi:hypothetical protein